jgi:hypothetical protein
MTNLFTVIENDDEEFVPTSREKFLRKAAKKLNEIERLEEKGKYHVLTREECEKLNQKDFWWACLYNEKLEPKKPSENKKKKFRFKRIKISIIPLIHSQRIYSFTNNLHINWIHLY